MGCHEHAGITRCGHNQFQFLQTEGWPGCFAWAMGSIRVNLDPIGTGANLPANHFAQMLAVGFLSIVAAIAAAEEVFYAHKVSLNWTSSGRSTLSDITKGVSTALTALLLGIIARKAQLHYHLLELHNALVPGQTFWDTRVARAMVVELILHAIHCPVGVYGAVVTMSPMNLVVVYDWDSLLSVAMMLRLWSAMEM